MKSDKMSDKENKNEVVEETISEAEKTPKVTKAKPKKRWTKAAKLEAALEEKSIEAQELKDKFLRLLAEFENFKKRSFKENLEVRKTASKTIIIDLLPVLDDFDRAKKSADDEHSPEVFSEGVELVYHKLKHVLEQKGLSNLDPTGDTFNAEEHEAITKIPAPDESMKGKIIDTIEKGYKLNDIVIRHPKVVVGD